ncbi:hypothetical protein AB0948_03235 [Streptomyces koyangensis]|uniref:hypothetical protein n=1 Tax=Streptomyces koyangensis TaxID=188770 RepID=UPI003454942E
MLPRRSTQARPATTTVVVVPAYVTAPMPTPESAVALPGIGAESRTAQHAGTVLPLMTAPSR